MRYFSLLLLSVLSIIQSNAQSKKFGLQDFYTYNSELEYTVDSIYNTLSKRQQVAQMIISSAGELGKPMATVKKLTENDAIGGVVFLKGSKKTHTESINTLNAISSKNKTLPLLFSMDAEPSLFASRIKGAKDVGKTIDIKTEAQSDAVVNTINTELREIGVHHNYAPVLDISASNEAIKSRSYGSDKDAVITLANQFIKCTQAGGIIATAKHFPGHGLVKGDTHKQSVYIDGPLQEVDNYKKIIEDGVLSIMIAHITIQNNEKYGTDGLPSSCSRKIITGLLKEEMGFKGIIISDALNIMKAVTILDNAPLLASKAGCDLILMPQNENATINAILSEMKTNPAYKKQIVQSVKKILRLKVCGGVI
ncbi:glycoside hydrolase family 3 N-terminal domain-containing protein [uncultured Aquimarina sp.]|uniref:glycoside hydrolase family 3 N-terminal domain-containing protein n=1 Tax=uncultured Aquimarina sp. TaxID=575652 RepID=UPI002610D6F1|nr:glycoside hydrolase family 3 N-terminal domain-containing protein [uncultured Aquimarina sp.]